MDALFDLVLTLAPISLFIALRIYASRKKKAEEDERARLAQFLAKATKEEESPRPTFAELSALVDETENYRAETETVALPATIAQVAATRPVASAGAAPRIEAMESASLSQVAPSSPRPTALKASGASPDARVFSRLERMSPLKRAVVMAEILGRPKGM